MAKLINNPDECGFVDRLPNYRDHICRNPKSNGLLCEDPNKFPKSCPLQDGITIPQTIEELIQLAKKEGLLFDVTKRTSNLHTTTLKEKSVESLTAKDIFPHLFKRRNRKDCLHYETGTYPGTSEYFHNCKGGMYANTITTCKGVNCGHFEPKRRNHENT